MIDEELEATVALSHLFPSKVARALIQQHGDAVSALRTLSFKETPWKHDLLLAKKMGASIISYQDPQYPHAFFQLKDPPLVLYVLGSLPKTLGIGIVGTRICTIYGKDMAERFGRECAEEGHVVVSGLARGIDTAAHRGALAAGKTVAVIGSGLNSIYPKENIPLAQEIAHTGGAVISAYPMNATPQKHHFPARNHLLAALCRGICLVEAPLKSGAMITMDLAEKMGKVCAALPGRVDMESFKGNHALIKSKKTHLVENGAELLSVVMGSSLLQKPSQASIFELDSEEKLLFSKLGKIEMSLEEITLATKMPIAKVSALLMGLVLKQMVREFPGKLYKTR